MFVNLLQHAVLIFQPVHKIARSKPDPGAYSQTTHSFRRGLRLFWEPWMWQWRMEWGGLLRLAVTWLPCWPVRCPSATKWVPADCFSYPPGNDHISLSSRQFGVDDFPAFPGWGYLSLVPCWGISWSDTCWARLWPRRGHLRVTIHWKPTGVFFCFGGGREGGGVQPPHHGSMVPMISSWFESSSLRCDGFEHETPVISRFEALLLEALPSLLKRFFQEKIDEAAEIYSEHFGDGDSQLKNPHPKSPFQRWPKAHCQMVFESWEMQS